MRKAFCSLILVFALTLPGMSMAAVQEFGPDFSRFTIDVPDGWTAQTKEGGVQLSSKDGNNSIVIQITKAGSAPIEEIAQNIAKSLEGKTTVTKVNDTVYKIHEANDDITIILSIQGGKMALMTYGGADTKTIGAIIQSMNDK